MKVKLKVSWRDYFNFCEKILILSVRDSNLVDIKLKTASLLVNLSSIDGWFDVSSLGLFYMSLKGDFKDEPQISLQMGWDITIQYWEEKKK